MADNILLGIKPQLKDVDKEFARLDKMAGKAGKRAGKQFSDKFSTGLDSFKLRALSAVATVVSALSGKVLVEAASRQEDAINKLNASLRQIGEFSNNASRDLQNFASGLQQVTRFGDEAIIEQLAFAQAMGATADQSKEILSAATDMAAGLNIDLNSAVRNITKTLGGYAGELGEVIPALKNLTTEQLQAGEGVKLLADRYRNFAQRDVETFSGAMDQMKNAFGDLLEEMGFLITNSKDVREAIVGIKNAFVDLGKIVKVAGPKFIQFMKDLGNAAMNPSRAAKSFIELKDALDVDVTRSLADFNKEIKQLESNLTNVEKEAQALSTVASADKGMFGEFLDRIFGDEAAVSNKKDQIDDIKLKIEELKRVRDALFPPVVSEEEKTRFQLLPPVNQELVSQYEEYYQALATQNDAISLNFDNLTGQMRYQAAQMKVTWAQMAKAAVSTLGRGFGSAFAAMGQALANGENALKAFGKAMIGILGDIAIQMGTSYILQGIAISANPMTPGAGGAMIAAGAALATFGGVLKALAGGGGGAVGAGGGATGGAGTAGGFEPTPVQTIEEERQGPLTGISVNIHGDVLDSQESGTRIVKLINDAFDMNGVVINQAGTA